MKITKEHSIYAMSAENKPVGRIKNGKVFGAWKKLLLLVVLLTTLVTAETKEKPNGPPVTKEEQKELNKVLKLINAINTKCGIIKELRCQYEKEGYDARFNDYYKKMTPEIRKAFIESTLSIFDRPKVTEKAKDIKQNMEDITYETLETLPNTTLFRKLIEDGVLDARKADEYTTFAWWELFGGGAVSDGVVSEHQNKHFLALQQSQSDIVDEPLSSYPSFAKYKKMGEDLFEYEKSVIELRFYFDEGAIGEMGRNYDITKNREHNYEFKKIVYQFIKGSEEKDIKKRKKMMHVDSLGFVQEDKNLNATYGKYTLDQKFLLFFKGNPPSPNDFGNEFLDNYIARYHLSEPRTFDEFKNIFSLEPYFYSSFLFVLGDYLIQKEKGTPRDVEALDPDVKQFFDEKIVEFSDSVKNFVTYRRNLITYRDIFFKLMEEYLKDKGLWDAPDVQENFDLLKGYFVKYHLKNWTDDFKKYDKLKLNEEEKYFLSYPTKKKK